MTMFDRSCHICKTCVCIGHEEVCELYLDAHAVSEAKDTSGKAPMHLVPMQIVEDIAFIREYGATKYKDTDNWKKVPLMQYMDAACRHLHKAMANPFAVDAESGLKHIHHCACNLAFICDMIKKAEDIINEKS